MAAFCGIEVITYCILSNHFHVLVKTPPLSDLPDDELVRRYAILYGPSEAQGLKRDLASSKRDQVRQALLKRMHDISFFMKELKMRFTIYYNKTHNRIGTLWAERFKSLLIESEGRVLGRNAVLAVAAYIDLNPVRAGLVSDPKDYRFCGYAEAVAGGSEAREGLVWLIGLKDWRRTLQEYRVVLFGTGVNSDRSREGGIAWGESRKVLSIHGHLPHAELIRSRIQYFSDGIALGSARFVAEIYQDLCGRRRRGESPGFPVGNESFFFARGRRSSQDAS